MKVKFPGADNLKFPDLVWFGKILWKDNGKLSDFYHDIYLSNSHQRLILMTRISSVSIFDIVLYHAVGHEWRKGWEVLLMYEPGSKDLESH
jgi:hypothetical protein